MANNRNLHAAKVAKHDEFYTQLADIEKEVSHYRKHFKGKIIYCNCDDPARSNFWRYFHLNFSSLCLKKLIATHYDAARPTYMLEYTGGDDQDIQEGVRTDLRQDGDFRSPECVELLQMCDMVVTNPPFSLMAEYLPMLVQSGKSFIVLGNINHITLRGIRGYIFDNCIWLGNQSGHLWFRVPHNHSFHVTDYRENPDGSKWRRIGGICWFTNLDIARRHEPLILSAAFSPEAYPKYDDYDAIECGKTDKIPADYFGVIGVPITYLPYHCHEQFDIIDLVTPKISGKSKYKRLLIKRTV